MLPHVVKGILKTFRILKWGSYSALFPWSVIHEREAREAVSIRGMQHRKTSIATVDFEDGREPWTKKFGHPVEARGKKKKNGFFSKVSRKNATCADTLILAQWDSFQILDLQNSKIICLYCFKPPNYGDFCSKQKLIQTTCANSFFKKLLISGMKHYVKI